MDAGMKVEKVKGKQKWAGENVVNLSQRLVTFSGEVFIGIFILAALILAIFAWLFNPWIPVGPKSLLRVHHSGGSRDPEDRPGFRVKKGMTARDNRWYPLCLRRGIVHSLRTRHKGILYSEKQPEVFMLLFFVLALIAWGILGLVLFSLSLPNRGLEEDRL